MPRLSTYVLKQLIGPVAMFAFLMTCVIWLTQALRLLDLIINRGQSATTFVYLSLLVVPSLLVLILPLSFFFGTLYALNRLNADSELVVMASAGYGRAQLALPGLVAAAIVMAITYLCSLYLMPAGQRTLNSKLMDIQANVGAALYNEGTFNTPAKGLTVFIRSIDNDGVIHGALVHDNRNPKAPITYFAESGRIVQTPAGMRLVMLNASMQRATKHGAKLEVLKFARYPFNLEQFAKKAQENERNTNPRFLGELLYPDPSLAPKIQSAYIAEAHNRLSQPLYCIAFVLIALAAVTRGRRGRGAHLLRLTMACFAASGLWIAGYGVRGMAVNTPALCVLFYALPLLGSGVAVWLLMGNHPKPAAAPPAEAAA